MSWIDRIIQKAVEARYPKGVGDQLYSSILRAVGSGNPVYMPDRLESYIQEGYLYNPSVYSIVSFIAQKASTIPWFVYNIKDKKALSLYKSGTPEMTLKKMQLQRKAMEPVESHELMQIFTKPNPLQGWAEFIEQAIGFKLVTGNTFIHAIGPQNGVNAGKLQEMWILPSQAIDILAGDKMNPIKGYQYMWDKSIVIPPEEVIHLKYWTPEYVNMSNLWGLSPIRAARRVVSKSNASYDAGTASMQNMGALGFIKQNVSASNPSPLTEEQAQAIEDILAKKTGPKNRGKALVTSADLSWQQIGMSPVDLAIIESDKMDLRTLCNVFHVPSELFNDASNKTYSNTQEASKAIWTNAVIPALTQFRDAFNLFIAGKYGDVFIDYDTSVIPELQENMEQLVNQLMNAWWITPNEKRELMAWDAEPIPEMDMMWIPSSLVPMNGWAEQEAAREQEAEANLAALNGEGEGPSDEELTEELKRLGINDYGTKGE